MSNPIVQKTQVRIGEERARAQNTDISRAKMMEKMSESFKPTTLLADDGNLKAKNEFKIAMEKYYKYNKETIAQLPEGMFYDIFLTFCDLDTGSIHHAAFIGLTRSIHHGAFYRTNWKYTQCSL